jgi:hypothetical protein
MSGTTSGAGAKLFSAQVTRRSKVKLGNPLVSPKKTPSPKKQAKAGSPREAEDGGDWITEGTYIPFNFEAGRKSTKVRMILSNNRLVMTVISL